MNQLQQTSHDRIIAKLQHFADTLQQTKADKENIAISIDQKENMKLEIFNLRNEISIYEEILNDYYDEFQEILTR